MTNISRRAVNTGAIWSVPVILTAVAAPTATASPGGPVDQPPVCIPGAGYSWLGEDTDSWNGNNLPQGIQVYNNTGRELTLTGVVSNTPAFRDVGIETATVIYDKPSKPTGGAFSVVISAGGSVIVRIGVEDASNNSTGFLTLTSVCDGVGRKMKTVNKIDRLG